MKIALEKYINVKKNIIFNNLILLVFITLVCFECSPNKSFDEKAKDTEQNVENVDSFQGNTKLPFKLNKIELGYISSYNHSVTEFEKHIIEQLLLDSLIIHDYFLEENNSLPSSKISDLIQVYRLKQNYFLIISEYHSPFGSLGLFGQVAIVDIENYIVSLKENILGSKYHTPEISWSDIDNDGQNEVISHLISPTSSVPVIDYYDTIYELKENPFELVEVIRITVESMNCVDGTIRGPEFSNNEGELIRRNYNFETPLKIKVVEDNYLFNCNQYGDSIKTTLKLIDKKKLYFARINKMGVFIEE